MKKGDIVYTLKALNPINYGTITWISPCGRYAEIQKAYGRRIWRKMYPIEDLELKCSVKQP